MVPGPGSPKCTRSVIPLALLPDAATSMTIPDSITSMGLGGDFGLPRGEQAAPRPGVRLYQIREAVGEFGLPEGEPGNYAGYQHRSFEVYAEVQVWSDVILNHRV